MTASNWSSSTSAGRLSYTRCRTSNDGTTSSVMATTAPRAPNATTAPANRSPSTSRLSVTRSPSAVTISIARTEVARPPLASPEPWVPVAQEPATEMCGRDARLGRA
ncbi:hypothetical protein [Microbispora sp. GKU 823]|uniref:hypothetical protein n=1 Tax=Microbispora sp. GKU 823 TaxID=1652100 RepID=UPI0009A33510|nr:hypothetical protein [Microbispora sp. GKU 823]